MWWPFSAFFKKKAKAQVVLPERPTNIPMPPVSAPREQIVPEKHPLDYLPDPSADIRPYRDVREVRGRRPIPGQPGVGYISGRPTTSTWPRPAYVAPVAVVEDDDDDDTADFATGVAVGMATQAVMDDLTSNPPDLSDPGFKGGGGSFGGGGYDASWVSPAAAPVDPGVDPSYAAQQPDVNPDPSYNASEPAQQVDPSYYAADPDPQPAQQDTYSPPDPEPYSPPDSSSNWDSGSTDSGSTDSSSNWDSN